MQYFGGLRGHAIDTPICLSVPITNGNRESTKVASNHLDGSVEAGTIAIDTGDRHVFALTSVVGFVQGAVGSATYKMEIRARKMCLNEITTCYKSSSSALFKGAERE